MKNKNLLLISYYFPPHTSAGALRPASIHNYLGFDHIDVTTITTKPTDDSPELGGNIIQLDTILNWRKQYLKRFPAKLLAIFLRKIGLWYISDIIWIKEAKYTINKILNQKSFDFVYCTFPVPETIFLGLYVKKNFDVKLISEFRDGLVFEPLFNLNIMQSFLLRKFEKNIIQNSNLIITISKHITNYFIKSYHMQRQNVLTVFNGYEKSNFEKLSFIKEKPENEIIKIAHFGSLGHSKKRDVGPLVAALKKIDNGDYKSINLQIDFIGILTLKEKNLLIREWKNISISHIKPFERTEGLKYIKTNYDYLLFFGVPGEKGIISTKIFDYMILDRPVIGICKDNEVADIIEETGIGEIFDFNEKSIYKALVKAAKKKISYNPRKNKINQFSRVKQAHEIANHLLRL